MSAIRKAIQSLKKAASSKALPRKIKDTIEDVASTISSSLLKGSPVSLKAVSDALSVKLRQSLVPVYTVLPIETLRFSAAIFTAIEDERIKAGNEGNQNILSWEAIQNAILSGVLAYAFLHETAQDHQENQKKLRNASLLGGVIDSGAEFLALDSLFVLLARLLPGTQTGRAKRAAFVQDVFFQPDIGYSKELIQILEHTEQEDWSHTSVRLMEVLAKHDISFPQPFILDEIRACGSVFPQPEFCDRIYVDTSGFCANVPEDSGFNETLTIPYTSVTSIETTPGIAGTTVKINLASPALVGQASITAHGNLEATFVIMSDETARFKAALGDRGLRDRLTAGPRKRAKISFPSAAVGLTDSPIRVTSKVPEAERNAYDTLFSGGLDRPSDPFEVVESSTKSPTKSKSFTLSESIGIPSRTSIHEPSNLSPKSGEALGASAIAAKSRIQKTSGGQGEGLSDPGDDARASASSLVVRKGRIIEVDEEQEPIPGKKSTKKMKKLASAIEPAETLGIDGSNDITGTLHRTGSPHRTRGNVRQDEPIIVLRNTPDAFTPETNGALLTTNAPPEAISYNARSNIESLGSNSEKTKLPSHAITPSVLKDVFADFLGSSLAAHTPLEDNIKPSVTAPRTADMKTRKANGNNLKPASVPNGKKRKQAQIPDTEDKPEQPPVKRRRGQNGKVSEAPLKKKGNKNDSTHRKLPRTSKARVSSPSNSVITTVDYDKVPDSAQVFKLDDVVSEAPRTAQAMKEHLKDLEPSPKPTRRTRASERKAIEPDAPQVPKIKAPKTPKRTRKVDNAKNDTKSGLTVHDSKTVKATQLHGKKDKKSQPNIKKQSEAVEINNPVCEDASTEQPQSALVASEKVNQMQLTSVKGKKTILEASEFRSSVDINIEEEKVEEFIPDTSDSRDFLMEYYVPTKLDTSYEGPAETSTPKKDIIMVDLTGDSPPTKPDNQRLKLAGITFAIAKNNVATFDATSEHVYTGHPVTPPSRVLPHRMDITAAPLNPAKAASSIAEHPIVPNSLLTAPDAHEKFVTKDNNSKYQTSTSDASARSRRQIAFVSPPHHSNQKVEELRSYSSSPQKPQTTVKSVTAASRVALRSRDDFYNKDDRKFEPRRRRGDEMRDIEEVLLEIHKAMVTKLEKKFEGVKRDVRIARDRILQQAAADFVAHYDALVDLQKDYAEHCRKTTQGWEDLEKINQQICQQIDQAIEDHDRNTLSKKFPKSIFSGPIPVFKCISRTK
ncbi:hypothetical protein HWV62_23136 [Athelia sp. TMB]|nr:hypothetical protein HWV62_23136 [Athelia sp. TMB]